MSASESPRVVTTMEPESRARCPSKWICFLLMPRICPSPWETYGCEWNAGYLWHWMNWLERLDVIALALMLAYVVLALIRVCRGYDSVRRAKANDTTRNLRKLTAELCIEVGN